MTSQRNLNSEKICINYFVSHTNLISENICLNCTINHTNIDCENICMKYWIQQRNIDGKNISTFNVLFLLIFKLISSPFSWSAALWNIRRSTRELTRWFSSGRPSSFWCDFSAFLCLNQYSAYRHASAKHRSSWIDNPYPGTWTKPKHPHLLVSWSAFSCIHTVCTSIVPVNLCGFLKELTSAITFVNFSMILCKKVRVKHGVSFCCQTQKKDWVKVSVNLCPGWKKKLQTSTQTFFFRLTQKLTGTFV